MEIHRGAPVTARSQNRRVLVVDDEPELVDALCESLQNEGFEAIGFTRPEEALRALRPGEFALLMSDLLMPSMSGIEVLREARTIDPDLVGLIMTGQASIEAAVEAMREGAVDFVLKPFRIKQSLPGLERALLIREARVEEARLKHEWETTESERVRHLEEANARLMALATTDPLTELQNRRGFDDAVTREVALAHRDHRPLALATFDIDHFKSFNDSFGHPAGDAVLKHVANIIQLCCRESDVAARIGGEEFAVLLPGTDADGAAVFAERVRSMMDAADWPLRSVTLSAGVADFDGKTESANSLVAAADDALYRAKRAGRNRVIVRREEASLPQ